jgi:hypothetical protein
MPSAALQYFHSKLLALIEVFEALHLFICQMCGSFPDAYACFGVRLRVTALTMLSQHHGASQRRFGYPGIRSLTAWIIRAYIAHTLFRVPAEWRALGLYCA